MLKNITPNRTNVKITYRNDFIPLLFTMYAHMVYTKSPNTKATNPPRFSDKKIDAVTINMETYLIDRFGRMRIKGRRHRE